MASFTPSSLQITSMGSTKLSIAHINEDIISGTNYWTTGITDIKSCMAMYKGGTLMVASSSNLMVTWTASTGTIHLINDASYTDTGYILWVISGGPDIKC
jgi:hypothetical protein